MNANVAYYLSKALTYRKRKMKTINWSLLVRELGQGTIEDFANGNISGRELYNDALDWHMGDASAEVRNLLRDRGVAEARKLARKALSRR